jgi:cyclic nucleotide gated channel alpha 3
VLSKSDLWEALGEYPDAQHLLIRKGREMLRKDGLLDEESAAAAEESRPAEARLHALRAETERLQMRQ